MSKVTNNIIGVDLFSGAGGMSIGAQWAGIDVQIAIEKDKDAAATYLYNHPNGKMIMDDISNVSSEYLFRGSPFVLFGGPPCQGFSHSNTKTRTVNNPNNLLFEYYLKFVRHLFPKWIVFENVQGITNFQKGAIVSELEDYLNKLGYITRKKILWASDFGVPQKRNRFFLIGNRQGIDYRFPESFNNKVTVNDAINDLPKLINGENSIDLPYKHHILNDYISFMRNGSKSSLQNFVSKNKEYVIERYKYIKPGQNWEAIPSNLMSNYSVIKNTHSGIYKRLNPNEPSVVISNYRKNMLIHPYENRGLSVREAARLQSFPDNFIFKGSLMNVQQQIGNAVPPLLAYAIFKSIMESSNGTNREWKSERTGLPVLAI